jgi:chaperone required for assembly of F1-ATPase
MSEDETPMGAAQRLARPALPRRFYSQVSVEPQDGGFGVLLDGRTIRTPAKRPLVVPRRDVADAMAAEWEAQGEEIDPASMPLTRLVNSAIDRVSAEMAAVRDDIVKHAGSDLICYRAEGPQPLVEVEERLWSPILAAAERALGVRFVLAGGIVHVGQEPRTLAAVGEALAPYDALSLAAIHSMTTLTGSALIALGVARGELSAEDAWLAAHADEDWQMSQWGADELALEARANRWRDMQAAVRLVRGNPTSA